MKGLHRCANRCGDLLYKGIRKSVLGCFFALPGLSTYAQTSKEHIQTSSILNFPYDVQPLTIGDKVPDISFHKVLNYKTNTARLYDFKGKLVILDMWSVYCASCIASFPKIEKLQSQLGDKIQILLVNPHDAKYESEEKIMATLDKFKVRTGFYTSLPVPIHDSILNFYFPHQAVPHAVWIGGDSSVIAITGSKEITEENIRKVLNGEPLNIGIKNDWSFDNTKPFLVDGNGGDSRDFVFRSIFTKYRSGIGFSSGVRINEQNQVTGLYMLNKSLRQLVGEAYADVFNSVSNNRVFIETNDQNKFNEFDEQNMFCYDLTFTPSQWKDLDLGQFLQEDLRRFFNISVHREKRKVTCIVLTKTDKLSKSQTKYMQAGFDLEQNSIVKYIRNHPVNDIIQLLDRFNKPMINETGINKCLDIEFPIYADLSDFNTVSKVLMEAGFNIHEEDRLIDVIVISDITK